MKDIASKALRVIIIDDEKRSVENLQMLMAHIDVPVECIGFAHNVMDGIKLINSVKPELVFLDIMMPNHTGFDLLEALDSKEFAVVFTTAYEEYAIQSLRHRAFDYLLKPIDLEELKNCLTRFINEKPKRESTLEPKQIKISVKDGMLFLKQKEIIRVEADGSYCVLAMHNGERHTISKNLKAMEGLLDSNLFYRCHNSHIINLSRVKKLLTNDGYFVKMEDDSIVEVSRSKKEGLLERL